MVRVILKRPFYSSAGILYPVDKELGVEIPDTETLPKDHKKADTIAARLQDVKTNPELLEEPKTLTEVTESLEEKVPHPAAVKGNGKK